MFRLTVFVVLPVWFIGLASQCAFGQDGQDFVAPDKVKVLPIFLVPADQAKPTKKDSAFLMRHMYWAQRRYRQMLKNKSTFELAADEPVVYSSKNKLEFYRRARENGAPAIVSEVLSHLKLNRYNCPHILLVVVMNEHDHFPVGGGRPLNGGINTGGGIVQLSSYAMNQTPNFQSTVEHELGHAFGLPHVDVYGYSMRKNDSIMSYNPAHHTRGFKPSRNPGKLIDEDLRALALNDRVFPKLEYQPTKKKSLKPVVTLGPMNLPQNDLKVRVTTTSGEAYNSSTKNILLGQIDSNNNDGKITYNPKTMWHSGKGREGWVKLKLSFPAEMELDQMNIYTQHSGRFHIANAIRISAGKGSKRKLVIEKRLASADETVKFKSTKSQEWTIELKSGDRESVVVRGIRLFSKSRELFPSFLNK